MGAKFKPMIYIIDKESILRNAYVLTPLNRMVLWNQGIEGL